jgi:hypothetical protein
MIAWEPAMTAVPVERTTAVTDLLLALVTAVGIRHLSRALAASWLRNIWLAALAAFGMAALLGAAAHGLALGIDTLDLLWQPLYLLLGTAVALFVVGAAGDGWGLHAGRRMLPPMLLLAALFYLATRYADGDFTVFVGFEAAGLLFALMVYIWLAVARRRAGATHVAAGLLLSLAGGALQALPSASARLLWEFDHNGLYHLVQLPGVVILVKGLGRTLQTPATNSSP